MSDDKPRSLGELVYEALGKPTIDCGPPIALKIEPVEATLTAVQTFATNDPAAAGGPTFRTCWNCNEAHEHLKSTPWLVCIDCGVTFLYGEQT